MPPILIAVIILGLGFSFLNGVHDSSNVVATMISSRAFTPQVALGITALANFLAPFLFGLAVADTIGNDVVASSSINITVIVASLVSAILWDILTLVPWLSEQFLPRVSRRHDRRSSYRRGMESHRTSRVDQNIDRTFYISISWLYLWAYPAQANSVIELGRDTKDQWAVQA